MTAMTASWNRFLVPCIRLISILTIAAGMAAPAAGAPAVQGGSPGAPAAAPAAGERKGKVDLVDLGIGWPRYRYSATNVTRPCASVYLLRKIVTNRLHKISLEAFQSAKRRQMGPPTNRKMALNRRITWP